MPTPGIAWPTNVLSAGPRKAVWLAFDAVVFLWVWLDDMYYAHDWKRKLKRMKDALTEE